MEDGVFFNQSKYIKEMLKKFGLEDSKPMKTPMSSDTKLTKDEECESVDSTKYRGMIGSLLYLTASRPDIMFSVCLCARFQEAPKTSHLEAVKRIFRYIKGTTHLGLWYPKGTDIETVVYADSDHARDYVDRKSTSGLQEIVVCKSGSATECGLEFQLGVKNIAKSFTSLVEGDKIKKRKKKTVANDKSVDYNPDSCGDGEKDDYEVATRAKLLQKQHRPQYIAPMAMNRYANLTKKRVSASNVPRVLPARDGCQRNGKFFDSNASKNNQSNATLSMAQLILSKKGSLRQKEDVNCNSKEMNSARKNMNNVDIEYDGAQNDDEDTDHVIFENIENEIEGDDAGFQDLNEYVREQHGLVDDEIEDTEHIMFGNNQNRIELGSDSEDESKNEIVERCEYRILAISTTKKRGPTMMHGIHVREFDARETIVCNKFGQPIRPVTKERDIVGQFSWFLGTIARNASYAPLTYSSWSKVPDKEMMWKYVL
ncbi:hypothetical protein Tco_0710447, partial [Tanacetum coccineum]